MTTYTDMETSAAGGQPFELYEFANSAGTIYYTSRAEVWHDGGIIYWPLAITRSSLRQGESVPKDAVTLTVARGSDLAQALMALAVGEVTTVTIKRTHAGLDPGEAVTVWKGRITGQAPEEEKYVVAAESIYTSIRRQGLSMKFELTCVWPLYGTGCGVNRQLYRTDVSVAVVDGVSVQLSGSFSAGYLTGGILEHEGAGRFIKAQSGVDTVTIARTLPDLATGDTVSVYPGCDHTVDTCRNKFGNLNNYLGFPWIPKQNPFDGRIL